MISISKLISYLKLMPEPFSAKIDAFDAKTSVDSDLMCLESNLSPLESNLRTLESDTGHVNYSHYACLFSQLDTSYQNIYFPAEQTDYITRWIDNTIRMCRCDQQVKTKLKALKLLPVESLVTDLKSITGTHKVFKYLANYFNCRIAIITNQKADVFSPIESVQSEIVLVNQSGVYRLCLNPGPDITNIISKGCRI